MQQEIVLMEENTDSLFLPLGKGNRKEKQGFRLRLATKLFKLYPNPANDYTTLKYNCKYINLTYSLIDISGKKIKTDILKTIENMETNEVLINLGGISPGTYYFVIKTNDLSLFTAKLVIAK